MANQSQKRAAKRVQTARLTSAVVLLIVQALYYGLRWAMGSFVVAEVGLSEGLFLVAMMGSYGVCHFGIEQAAVAGQQEGVKSYDIAAVLVLAQLLSVFWSAAWYLLLLIPLYLFVSYYETVLGFWRMIAPPAAPEEEGDPAESAKQKARREKRMQAKMRKRALKR